MFIGGVAAVENSGAFWSVVFGFAAGPGLFTGVPQLEQNFESFSNGLPHFMQNIKIPHFK
jgi:hypothetical protein